MKKLNFDKIDKLLLADGERYYALDGLRTIAITLVIFRHVYDRSLKSLYDVKYLPNLPKIFHTVMGFGWVGVHLFFTLSGFLIGGIIYRKLQSDSFSFKNFYLSRSLRIFPVFWVYITIYAWKEIGLNYRTIHNFLYVANYTGDMFITHIWSLCVEEHFYIVFPFVFYYLHRNMKKKENGLLRSILIIIALEWVFRGVYAYAYNIRSNFIYYRSHFHIDFLLLGVVGAILCEQDQIPRKPLLGFLIWLLPLGYLGLAAITYKLNDISIILYSPLLYTFAYPLIAIWCFLTVVLVKTQNNIITRILSFRLFRWIAVLSYSIYLFHLFPVESVAFMELLKPMMPKSITLGTILIISVIYASALLFATISFFCIERPFLLLRKRFR